MTTRDVTIAGFIVLFAAAAVLVVVSRVHNARLAHFGDVIRAMFQRHVMIRATVLFGWAWLGWHFLARTGA
ncbi:MAG TPA: DUF6186 family protein [Jiangellaceae bacterium]